jgi:hypothetical protein
MSLDENTKHVKDGYSPLSTHVLNHDTANTEDICGCSRVLNLGVFVLVLLHGLMHVICAVPQDIVQAIATCVSQLYNTKQYQPCYG